MILKQNEKQTYGLQSTVCEEVAGKIKEYGPLNQKMVCHVYR